MPPLHKVDKEVQAEHIFLVLVVSANRDLEFGYKARIKTESALR
jgi:hypothetical protein